MASPLKHDHINGFEKANAKRYFKLRFMELVINSAVPLVHRERRIHHQIEVRRIVFYAQDSGAHFYPGDRVNRNVLPLPNSLSKVI